MSDGLLWLPSVVQEVSDSLNVKGSNPHISVRPDGA